MFTRGMTSGVQGVGTEIETANSSIAGEPRGIVSALITQTPHLTQTSMLTSKGHSRPEQDSGKARPHPRINPDLRRGKIEQMTTPAIAAHQRPVPTRTDLIATMITPTLDRPPTAIDPRIILGQKHARKIS